MWSSLEGHAERSWSARRAVFGALLGRLGHLWARLGALEGYVGDPLGGYLGRLGAGLEGSGAVQERGTPKRR
eukprot:405254-Pyramimonas_sp.AAC.1